MQVGSNWGGNYSRFTFDETKHYFYMMKEQGVPVLDDEFNLLQEINITLLRRLIIDMFGDGAPNNGFKVVGTGASNDFTITGGDGTLDGAGHFYINGYLLVQKSNVAYSAQGITQSALTTPSANRVDEVYIEVYLDEIDAIKDPVIKDPSLLIETSRRLQLKYEVKVAEGSVTPASYVDANGITHYTKNIAVINRTASNTINAGMVVDKRKIFDDGINNLIAGSGQLLDASDTQQLHKSVAHYSSAGDYYVDNGAVNAYVLSAIGNQVPPPAYVKGMRVRFYAANANTGASTINVAGYGIKNLKDSKGGDLLLDSIPGNELSEAYYDGVDFRVVSSNVGRVLLKTLNASNSAYVTFNSFPGIFKKYEIDIIEVVPVANNVNMLIQAEALAAWGIPVNIALSVSNITGNGGASGKVDVYSPNTVSRTGVISHIINDSTVRENGLAAGDVAGKTTGLRFFMSSGNILIGEFKLYGVN